jgi:hypothetical protein
MREISKSRKTLIIIALLVIIGLVFLASSNSQDGKPPIITGEEAVQIALSFLENKHIQVPQTNVVVGFSNWKWCVMFLVDPYSRPGAILVLVNPITGIARLGALK